MKVLSTLMAGACIFIAGHSLAADAQVHLRGEVTAVSATEMTIRDRKGGNTTVELPEQIQVLDVSRTSIDAIQESSYLGIAAAPAPQSRVRALGVMVFPEMARGVNEGHFPWDKGHGSSMTNATVAKLLRKKSTTELEMRFGEKSQLVVLDKGTVFAQFVPGKRDLIAVGAKVLVIGAVVGKATAAQLVMVGRDGFVPPI